MEKLKVRLRNSRKSAGYTQENLSKILGFSQVSLIEWEKGRVEPKKSVIERWAEITKCDPSWLLTGRDQDHDNDILTPQTENIRMNPDVNINELAGLSVEIKDEIIRLMHKENNELRQEIASLKGLKKGKILAKNLEREGGRSSQ